MASWLTIFFGVLVSGTSGGRRTSMLWDLGKLIDLFKPQFLPLVKWMK